MIKVFDFICPLPCSKIYKLWYGLRFIHIETSTYMKSKKLQIHINKTALGS